jgi:hypothetical protein
MSVSKTITTISLAGLLAAGGTTAAFADETPAPAAETPAAATDTATATPEPSPAPATEENNTPAPEQPNNPAPPTKEQNTENGVSTIDIKNGVGTSSVGAEFKVEFNSGDNPNVTITNISQAHSKYTWLAQMDVIPEGYNLGAPSQGEIASGQALIDAKVVTPQMVHPDGLYWYIGSLTPGQDATLALTKAPAPAETPAPTPEPDKKAEPTPEPDKKAEVTPEAPKEETPAEQPAAPADGTPAQGDTQPATGDNTNEQEGTGSAENQGEGRPGAPAADTPADGENVTVENTGATTPAQEGEPVTTEYVSADGVSTPVGAGPSTPYNGKGQNVSSVKPNTSSTVKGQRLKTGEAGVAAATTNTNALAASGGILGGLAAAVAAVGAVLFRRRRS